MPETDTTTEANAAPKLRIVVEVDHNQTFDWWVVRVEVPDFRPFRPCVGIDYPSRTIGAIYFTGQNAELNARDGAEQLRNVLRRFEECVPHDDVDAILEGVAKQVGATQMANPDSLFAGVVRSYQRDGAWKSMHHQASLAREETARLRETVGLQAAESALLHKQNTALRMALEEHAVETLGGPTERYKHCIICDATADTSPAIFHKRSCPLAYATGDTPMRAVASAARAAMKGEG